MYAQVKKPKENESRAVANPVAQKKSSGKQGFGLVDNRREVLVQRKVADEIKSIQFIENDISRSNSPKLNRGMVRDTTLQLANKNGRKRQKEQAKAREEKSAKENSDYRVDRYGENWADLKIETYLNKHNLKKSKVTKLPGKVVITLQDGSIILKDVNGYWRHESAFTEDAYYDENHIINADNALTHFWDR